MYTDRMFDKAKYFTDILCMDHFGVLEITEENIVSQLLLLNTPEIVVLHHLEYGCEEGLVTILSAYYTPYLMHRGFLLDEETTGIFIRKDSDIEVLGSYAALTPSTELPTGIVKVDMEKNGKRFSVCAVTLDNVRDCYSPLSLLNSQIDELFVSIAIPSLSFPKKKIPKWSEPLKDLTINIESNKLPDQFHTVNVYSGKKSVMNYRVDIPAFLRSDIIQHVVMESSS